MKTRILFAILILVFLAACTPRPLLSKVALTATAGPCTDRGWSEITSYLLLYDGLLHKIEGISLKDYFDDLGNYVDKVKTVVIDACTEQVRQLIVDGMNSQIHSVQITRTGYMCYPGYNQHGSAPQVPITCGSQEDEDRYYREGAQMLWDAKSELAGLGIDLGFPLFGGPPG